MRTKGVLILRSRVRMALPAPFINWAVVRAGIDDPATAFALHGGCGMWGLLSGPTGARIGGHRPTIVCMLIPTA